MIKFLNVCLGSFDFSTTGAVPRIVDNNNNNHDHVLSTSDGSKLSAYIISLSDNSPIRDIRSNHMELLIL